VPNAATSTDVGALFATLGISLAVAAAVIALFYGLILLARIARELRDMRERLDDMRLRLGVLDPGDTRINPFAQPDALASKLSQPAASSDETLPSSG
jgi:hypothetical protein